MLLFIGLMHEKLKQEGEEQSEMNRSGSYELKKLLCTFGKQKIFRGES